jgi:hypothetical protein
VLFVVMMFVVVMFVVVMVATAEVHASTAAVKTDTEAAAFLAAFVATAGQSIRGCQTDGTDRHDGHQAADRRLHRISPAWNGFEESQ